jgi:hypothetical protein
MKPTIPIGPPAVPREAHTPLKPSLDRDALEALAWIESGMPDSKVDYGPDAPKLSPEQLEQFKAAAYLPAPENSTRASACEKGCRVALFPLWASSR